MTEFFRSGFAFDLVLACLVAEACLLCAFRMATGRGLALPDILAFLGAGFGLALAARGAVAGLPWIWVAGGLSFALAAHLYDMSRRWRRSERSASGPS